MNLMQSNLEQAYKDFLDIKIFVDTLNKRSPEDTSKKVAEKALEKETFEEQLIVHFEEYYETKILEIDLMEAKKKLYYMYLSYKDLVEIPENIAEEIKDFKIPTVFAIISGEKKIIDKELYNSYKNQYIEYSKQVKEKHEGTN